jgi:hypothetical protein
VVANHIIDFQPQNGQLKLKLFWHPTWRRPLIDNSTSKLIEINGIPLFFMSLIAEGHPVTQITYLLDIFLHHTFTFSACRIFEYSRDKSRIRLDESMDMYGSTNPRFDIEYSNIRIRPSQNSVHIM